MEKNGRSNPSVFQDKHSGKKEEKEFPAREGETAQGVTGRYEPMEKALFASWERHEIIAPCSSAPLFPTRRPPASSLPPALQLLHTHPTVLFIDDSSLPFLSGRAVNTGTLVPRGPNGLISTVYSCALFLE